MTPAPQSLQLDAQNPWPGLATYDEGARHFFFGRDAETDELMRLINLSPLTVLYGKSGLGKSSLLQAGLFPKLRATHFLPVYIRLDIASAVTMPFPDQARYWLQTALQAAKADYPPFVAGEDLWCYLHRRDLEIWSADNRLLTPVLVFDQFEEVFSWTHSDLPTPRVLCHGLADLIENKIPSRFAGNKTDKRSIEKLDVLSQHYRVLLSFREDFLPTLKNWEQDVPSLLKNWCQLKPLSRQSAVEAVTKSGEAILAADTSQAIVDFVGNLDADQTAGDTSIEPVLLSLCCYQLNLRRQKAKAPRIDVDLLRKVGQEILQGYYANALANLPKSVGRFIETKLIQGKRYRSSYPVKLALDEGLLTEEQIRILTDKHRLLRIDQQMGTPRLELIHDRLVSVVRSARDRSQAKAEIHRAWLLASLGVVLAVSFGFWQQWEGRNRTELMIQTTEALLNRGRGQIETLPPDQPVIPNPSITENHQSDPNKSAITDKKIIYVQIRNPDQLAAAQKVRSWFNNHNYRVPGIEQLPRGPSTTEVRYFRNDDSDQAQMIADQLLKLKIATVTTKYIAGFEESKVVSKGQFEIWFAPEAFN